MERGRLAYRRKSMQQLFAQSLLARTRYPIRLGEQRGSDRRGPGRRGPEGPWGDMQVIGGLKDGITLWGNMRV